MTASGSTAHRVSPGTVSIRTPDRAAISPQMVAKRPDSSTKTVSSRLSVLQMAICQAP